mgnify:CR=1 FL=1
MQIYRHAYLSSYKIGSAIVNMKSQDHYGSVSYMMYPGVYNIEPTSINSQYVKVAPKHNKLVAVVKSRTSTAAVGAPTYVNLNFDRLCCRRAYRGCKGLGVAADSRQS